MTSVSSTVQSVWLWGSMGFANQERKWGAGQGVAAAGAEAAMHFRLPSIKPVLVSELAGRGVQSSAWPHTAPGVPAVRGGAGRKQPIPAEATVTTVFSKATECNLCCTLTSLPPSPADTVTSGKCANERARKWDSSMLCRSCRTEFSAASVERKPGWDSFPLRVAPRGPQAHSAPCRRCAC